MFDKKQYITDSFLKAQKYWIEKQKSSKKKINAKMALLPFLMPNLDKNLVNIAGHESDWNMYDEETSLIVSKLTKEFEDFNKDNVIPTWKTCFQSIPSKSLEEYTVNDIHQENANFIIELQALEQLLKNKIMVTIQSKFKINNITLNSQLTLDIFNINDVKLLHNQVLLLFPNGGHRLNVPLNVNNKRHNINFIENKITDSKGNIVFHLKQVTDENKYPSEQSVNAILFESYKNAAFLQKHKITQQDLENLLSKVELDILNHPSMTNKTINQNQSLITVDSTYQDFIQLFQPNDYFSQSNNNLTDMYLAYVDLFHIEYITRYDLKKNWIQYFKPKKEYAFDSFKDCLHQYKKHLDYQFYQSSKKNAINKSKVLEDISNEEFCLTDLANYFSDNAKKDVTIGKHFLRMNCFKELNRISNSSGYLTRIFMNKYFNKFKTILNRLKSFKHYVFLFNPDIKDIYYSSVLNNCYKIREDNFNNLFNMLTIMKTCYPNLINNLMKYKQENAGLFPLIINAKLHDINNGVDDLLSFNKNKHLFDSKNQFKLLNKRKSSVLTKLYMALHISNSIYIGLNINDSFKNCYFYHKHPKDMKDTPDFSQINMSHENYLLLKNIKTHVFWLLLSNRCFSIKQIHFMMRETNLHLLMISFPFVKHFDNKTTQIIIKIIIQHWYQLLLNVTQKSKKEKMDWRTQYEKIIENFKEFDELKRDYYTIHDFLGTLASSNTTINDVNKYINESKWKSYFHTNNYNEVVTRCLTEKIDDKFLLTIINKENDLFEFPLHKELKLNDKSTFKSLITYIQEYDKFYATQKHILDNQVCDYNKYPITIEKIQIGEITITPVSNSTELLYEGNAMQHCVYSYRDLCKNAEYVVFHITDNTEYKNGQNVIKELTLGLSVFKHHYGTLTDIKNSQSYQKFKEYRQLPQDNKTLGRSPTHNNLYFAFNQCFGHKNDYIVNDEQIDNINLVINQLLYKLNCDFLDSVGL